MNPVRRLSILIGVLILLSFVFGVLSIEPSVDSDQYLDEINSNIVQVKFALLAQLGLAFIYVFIAILIFEFLKQYTSALSYSYLSFSIISQIFNIIGTIAIFSLVLLSQQHNELKLDNNTIMHLGNSIKNIRDYCNHVLMIITNCVASFFLSLMLLRTKIIPTGISLLGLLGSVIAIIASVLVLYTKISVLSTTYIVLNIPIVLQQLLFALYLVIWGFRKITTI